MLRRAWLWLRTKPKRAADLTYGDRLLVTNNLSRGPYLTDPLRRRGPLSGGSPTYERRGRPSVPGGDVWVQIAPTISVGFKPDQTVRVAR
jgi:hypothetical protein